VGGMLVPAVIYSIFNSGTEYSNGWGIPMATDIAFSLAIISMLGKKIPNSIKIFLAALAIVDDLGAILVIAIFYTEQIHWSYLLLSFGVTALLFILNFLKVTKTIFYIIPGCFYGISFITPEFTQRLQEFYCIFYSDQCFKCRNFSFGKTRTSASHSGKLLIMPDICLDQYQYYFFR
jgi:hypothetical protein